MSWTGKPGRYARVRWLGHTPRHGISSVQYNRTALNTAFGANPLGYDILDRLQSRATHDGKRLTHYGYDALGRLSGRTEDKLTWVPPPGFCDGNSTEPECDGYWEWRPVRLESFGYDAVGNRNGWTYSDSTGTSLSFNATLQPSSNRYAA